MSYAAGIIGSAIAGPTLGLQLLSHPILASRFKPIIFDKSPALPNISPSTIPLLGPKNNGLFPLYNLNLRAALDEVSSELSCLTIWRSGYGSRSADEPDVESELQTNARAIERQILQRLLVSEYIQRGGEVQWDKNAVSFSRQESGQMQVLFADGTNKVVDLLVGADGGFSAVRKFILHERHPSTSEARWLPDFMGMTGFYGISTPAEALAETRTHAETRESTHAIWLDDGNLSAAPLPSGKIRWDLIISEKNPPDFSSSVEILKKHAGIYHPVVGNFGRLLESATRIIRSPLRQRVWTEEEIQRGNVVLIGDAARLMLPSNATVLANTLLNRACSEGVDPGHGIRSALKEYAALRVPRSKKMASIASLAGRVALGDRWYSRLLRDLGSRITVGSDLKVKPGKEPWPFDERVKVQLAKD
ncbi:hypothetical protein K438DRAFT_1915627 [Mycena galopus ATCC 62051]|nr:hypothetical protein K438DRAFT_1915627 [Mycena galopus ATCC 62051]